jgi:PTH1 family peptidyl-tRNA hydrolase
MTIIIGLGNPGDKYKKTRHNIGFMALDKYAEKNNFPEFKLQKKLKAEISEKDDVILAKPQTFMNESGKAVREITKNRPDGNLIIIHDDIDLPVGKIKIVKERGSAGHKGVESIVQNIGNEGLIRVRVGIGGSKDVEAMKVVLKNFSIAEQEAINQTMEKISNALRSLMESGLDKTMNEYNK